MSAEIQHLLRILRALQTVDPEFPLQYAVCLAEIAMDEGLCLTQLSERTGLTLSTVSRIVGALSRHRQSGQPYGLVNVTISKTERRRKELSLTPQGRAVISDVETIIRDGEPQRLRA